MKEPHDHTGDGCRVCTMDMQVGDVWVIWITGLTTEYRARVMNVDPPRLEVLDGGSDRRHTGWPTLRRDDFILRRREQPETGHKESAQ